MSEYRKRSKLTNYASNVAKSTAFSIGDSLIKSMPSTARTIEKNSDLVKDVMTQTRDFKSISRRGKDYINSIPILKELEKSKKNAMSDLRSGNFYNKNSANRESNMDSDFDDMFEDGMNDMSIGNDDDRISHSVKASSMAGAKLTSNTIIDAAKLSSETIQQMSNAQMEQESAINANNLMFGMKQHNEMMSAMDTTSSNIEALVAFNNENTLQYYTSSTEYFDASIDIGNKQLAILKEMREIQGNKYEESVYEKSKISKVIGLKGELDIKSYTDIVKTQIKESLSEATMGMTDMLMDKELMEGVDMSSSPLKFISDGIASAVIKPFESSLTKFDSIVSNFGSTFIMKMNRLADSDNPLFKILGDTFGIKTNAESIDLTKYMRSESKFTNMTNKAIVDVIPSYLGKILSAVTGKEEILYKYDEGKFKTKSKMKKKYDIESDSHIDKMSGTSKAINDKLKYIQIESKEEQDKLNRDVKAFLKHTSNKDALYNPYKDTNITEIGMNLEGGQNSLDIINGALKASGREAIMNMNKEIIKSRNELRKNNFDINKNLEMKGYSQLLNSDDIDSVDGTVNTNVNNIMGNTTMKSNSSLLNIMTDIKKILLEGIKVFPNNISIDDSDSSNIVDSRLNAFNKSINKTNKDEYNKNLQEQKYHEMTVNSNITEKGYSSVNNLRQLGNSDSIMNTMKRIQKEEVQVERDKERDLLRSNATNNSTEDAFGQYKDYMKRFKYNFKEKLKVPVNSLKNGVNKLEAGMFKLFYGDYGESGDVDADDPDHLDNNRPPINFKEFFKKLSGNIFNWTKDKILDPLDEKLFGDNGIMTNLSNKMESLKLKLSDKFFGSKGVNGSREGGIFSGVFNNLHDMNMGVINYMTGRGYTSRVTGENVPSYDNNVLSFIKSDINKFTSFMSKNIFGKEFGKGDLKETIVTKLNEGTDKFKTMMSNLTSNLFGTDNVNKFNDILNNDIKPHKEKLLAGAGMGAVGSLVLPGGPILGAMLGSAASFVSTNDKAKKFIFGTEGVDGEWDSGLISKKLQDGFKKYAPHGMAGMGTGWLAGATVGKLGIMGSMLVPGGPLGGAIIGASIGIGSQSEKVKSFLFGKMDPDTFAREGGVFGKVKNWLDFKVFKPLSLYKESTQQKLKEWFHDNIGNPFKDALAPLKAQMKMTMDNVKTMFKQGFDAVKEGINDVFERHVGKPLGKLVEDKLLNPLKNLAKGLFTGAGKIIGGIVSSPFRFINSVAVELQKDHNGTVYGDYIDDEKTRISDRNKKQKDDRASFWKSHNIKQKSLDLHSRLMEKSNWTSELVKNSHDRHNGNEPISKFANHDNAVNDPNYYKKKDIKNRLERDNPSKFKEWSNSIKDKYKSSDVKLLNANHSEGFKSNKVNELLSNTGTKISNTTSSILTKFNEYATDSRTRVIDIGNTLSNISDNFKSKLQNRRNNYSVNNLNNSTKVDHNTNNVDNNSNMNNKSDMFSGSINLSKYSDNIKTIKSHTSEIRKEVVGQLDGLGHNLHTIRNIMIDNYGTPSSLVAEYSVRGNKKYRGRIGKIIDAFKEGPLGLTKAIFRGGKNFLKDSLVGVTSSILKLKPIKRLTGAINSILSIPKNIIKFGTTVVKDIHHGMKGVREVLKHTIKSSISVISTGLKETVSIIGDGMREGMKLMSDGIHTGLVGIRSVLDSASTFIKESFKVTGSVLQTLFNVGGVGVGAVKNLLGKGNGKGIGFGFTKKIYIEGGKLDLIRNIRKFDKDSNVMKILNRINENIIKIYKHGVGNETDILRGAHTPVSGANGLKVNLQKFAYKNMPEDKPKSDKPMIASLSKTPKTPEVLDKMASSLKAIKTDMSDDEIGELKGKSLSYEGKNKLDRLTYKDKAIKKIVKLLEDNVKVNRKNGTELSKRAKGGIFGSATGVFDLLKNGAIFGGIALALSKFLNGIDVKDLLKGAFGINPKANDAMGDVGDTLESNEALYRFGQRKILTKFNKPITAVDNILKNGKLQKSAIKLSNVASKTTSKLGTKLGDMGHSFVNSKVGQKALFATNKVKYTKTFMYISNSKVMNALRDFFSNSKILGLIGKKGIGKKIFKELGPSIAKALLKATGRAGMATARFFSSPLGWVAFAVADFGTGMAETKNILQIPNDAHATWAMRIASGLAKALSGLFTFGLLPASILANPIYDLLSNEEAELKLDMLQNEMVKNWNAYNELTGVEMDFNEYNNAINESFWDKSKRVIGDYMSPITETDSSFTKFSKVINPAYWMTRVTSNTVSFFKEASERGFLPTLKDRTSGIFESISNITGSIKSTLLDPINENDSTMTKFVKLSNPAYHINKIAGTVTDFFKDGVEYGFMNTVKDRLARMQVSILDWSKNFTKLDKWVGDKSEDLGNWLSDKGSSIWKWMKGDDKTDEEKQQAYTDSWNTFAGYSGPSAYMNTSKTNTKNDTSISSKKKKKWNWFTGETTKSNSKTVNPYQDMINDFNQGSDIVERRRSNREKYYKGDGHELLSNKILLDGSNMSESEIDAEFDTRKDLAKKYYLNKEGTNGKGDARMSSATQAKAEQVNGFPYYSQYNKAWKNISYRGKQDKGKPTIGSAGCGPTSMAMVLSSYLNKPINPIETTRYALQLGSKLPNGTAYSYFKNTGDHYGVDIDYKGTPSDNELDIVKQNVAKGKPVIMVGTQRSWQKSSPFTKGGHYSVAVGLDSSNNLIFNDPRGKKYSVAYDDKTVKDGMRHLWYTSKGGEGVTKINTSAMNAFNTSNGTLNNGSSNNPLDLIGSIIKFTQDEFNRVWYNKEPDIPTSYTPNVSADLGMSDHVSDFLNGDYMGKSLGKMSPKGNPIYVTPKNSTRLFSNKDEFMKNMVPLAKKAYTKYGILPSLTLGQAAHESAWGKSAIGYNLFGKKEGSTWKGPVLKTNTSEFIDPNTPINTSALFRNYASLEDGVMDYAKGLARWDNYEKVANATNYKDAVYGLKGKYASYATDPKYYTKLINTIESNGFDKYDVLGAGDSGIETTNNSNVITSVNTKLSNVNENVTTNNKKLSTVYRDIISKINGSKSTNNSHSKTNTSSNSPIESKLDVMIELLSKLVGINSSIVDTADNILAETKKDKPVEIKLNESDRRIFVDSNTIHTNNVNRNTPKATNTQPNTMNKVMMSKLISVAKGL